VIVGVATRLNGLSAHGFVILIARKIELEEVYQNGLNSSNAIFEKVAMEKKKGIYI
jgi:hypothetical protein